MEIACDSDTEVQHARLAQANKEGVLCKWAMTCKKSTCHIWTVKDQRLQIHSQADLWLFAHIQNMKKLQKDS